MPSNDDYGQGVSYAMLDDAPDAQTLGEGIVNGLVPQSIMRFNSAAHRGAVVAAPAAGMVAWLRDQRILQLYDGTSWVTFGTATTPWANVSVGNGWSHGAPENSPDFQYRVINFMGEPTLALRGNIQRPTPYDAPGSWLTITNTPLPVHARPQAIRRTVVACSGISSTQTQVRLDVRTTGEMRIYDLVSAVRPPWISFDGVFVSL